MKKTTLSSLPVFFALLLLLQVPAFSQKVVGCGCYCGKVISPPCSESACKSACGWSSGSGGGGGNSGGYDNSAAIEAQRQAELARREEEARKKAEEEKRKKEQFEAEKQDALRSLKGVSTVEPGLKGLTDCQDESCENDMNFFDYHERQTERREILANLNKNLAIDKTLKPRVDWCKLHIPLPPSPAGACYCDKQKAYEDRMDTWRAKCAAAAASIPVKQSGKTQRSASFCLSAYDTAVSACDGNHFEMASCINKAIGVYIRCLGDENQESGVPLK